MDGFSLKWCTGYTALYAEPNPQGKKVRDLLEKSLVMTRDEVVLWQGHAFVQVEYHDAKAWRGWVYAGMLEDYVEHFPKDCVVLDNQTPAANDFEQYLTYNGARQVNLCGQISAAYCLNLPLAELLGKWKQEQATIWRRIFPKAGAVAGGTGVADLISMFQSAGKQAYPLVEALRDPYLKRSRYTPGWMDGLMEKGKVIAGVRIDSSGRLAASGILHWVVVTTVEAERCGYGIVTVFNPAPNRIEAYSWREFTQAAGNPAGVFVPEETL